jgi:isochorismate synthase
LTKALAHGVHDVVNNAERAPNVDTVVEVFDRAVREGVRAFLFSPPGGDAAFVASGDGMLELRVGALGFAMERSLWRPARVVATEGAFETAPREPTATPSTGQTRPAGRIEPETAIAPTDDAPTAAPDAAFCARVEQARARCADGVLRKVVLARVETRTAPPGRRFDPGATFRALRAAEPEAFAFAAYEDGRTFVGASPERLASRTVKGVLYTEALAGTSRRDLPPSALLDSPKDREEHAIVVEAILESLKSVTWPPGPWYPATPAVRTFARVSHLHTPIAGCAHLGLSLYDIVRALHPTPAVGGTPRAAALAFLREFEGFDRGPYAGPVGWLADDGRGCFAVGIRSAELAGETARLFAGAGIVAASDAAAEWRETALKLRTAAEALRTC